MPAATPAGTPPRAARPHRVVDHSAGPARTLFIVGAFYTSVHLALRPQTNALLHRSDANTWHPLLMVPLHGWVGKGAPAPAPGLAYFHGARATPWMRTLVSPAVAVGLPFLYVLAVLAGTRLMRGFPSQKTFLKTSVQPVYNILQIVVCAYMVWGLWPRAPWTNPLGLNEKTSASVEWFVFVHYCTKYLDWLDTLFMILSKNYHQVSFLQVFHHATIGMVWGLVLDQGWGSGTVSYGAFINSVTHVLLYSHYLVTSLGYSNPLRKGLFLFQQAQFLSCIVHALLVWSSWEHVYPKNLVYLQVLYHPVMLFLFGSQLNWVPHWLIGIDAPAETKKNRKKAAEAAPVTDKDRAALKME